MHCHRHRMQMCVLFYRSSLKGRVCNFCKCSRQLTKFLICSSGGLFKPLLSASEWACERQRARKWPNQEMAWFDGLISDVARELLRTVTLVTLTMFFILDDIVGRLSYRWSLKYVLFFRCHSISYFLYYVSQSIFMFSFLDAVFVISKDFS